MEKEKNEKRAIIEIAEYLEEKDYNYIIEILIRNGLITIN